MLDLSTVIAGPNCARYLADFGADVIKVERADGDSLRTMAWRDERDGDGLWFKLANRGKRTIVLDLKDDADRDVLLGLVADASVLVENFRPGRLERLGLGPDVLHARNPRLVVTRISGFGQDGPYAGRPGFATIAEAMGGFAAINGEPGGQPLLPPMALTDEATGLAAAFATMVALHSGHGQVVDVNLLETMLHLMGPLPSVYALQGELQPRLGAGLPYTVPRGTYRCADGRWIAVSTSSNSIARRVMVVLGVGDDPRFATFEGRAAARDELEAIDARRGARRGRRPRRWPSSTAADAAAGPVMDMADIAADPHVVGPRRDHRRRRHADAGPHRPPQRDTGRGALAGPAARRRRRRHPRTAGADRTRLRPAIGCRSSALGGRRGVASPRRPSCSGLAGTAWPVPTRVGRRRVVADVRASPWPCRRGRPPCRPGRWPCP